LLALVLVLRFGAVLLTFAFAAVFLPTSWMAAVHSWLGMGEFPAAPLTDYLARSVSALYGFHGVLLFIVSGDPVRCERIVLYLGVANVVFGLMLFGIDLHAGLPIWWTAFEGPPVVGLGVLLLYLRGRAGIRKSASLSS
jgi:hypothetical protein